MRQASRKHKLKLSRALRRNCSFRDVVTDDLKYLWAAYKKGAFPEHIFPQGMEVVEFNALVHSLISNISMVYMLERDGKPMGLVTANLVPPNRMEPHVDWFPWATNRNKLECAIKFLNEMRKRGILLIVWSKKDATPFFTHIAKYGILHRIGKVINYNGKKEDAMLFQGR